VAVVQYTYTHESKFEFDIYEAPDKLFGNMDEKGNWNGMVNELMLKVRYI